MDMKGKDGNSCKTGSESKLVIDGNLQKIVMNGNREEEDESKSLLSPRKGGILTKSGKKQRKVQWNDKNGNNLTEVLEYQPSEASDSEDEESDSCICSIM